MRAQEMEDHLWCARLSLEDGLLLVWLLGGLDALLRFLESTQKFLTLETG